MHYHPFAITGSSHLARLLWPHRLIIIVVITEVLIKQVDEIVSSCLYKRCWDSMWFRSLFLSFNIPMTVIISQKWWSMVYLHIPLLSEESYSRSSILLIKWPIRTAKLSTYLKILIVIPKGISSSIIAEACTIFPLTCCWNSLLFLSTQYRCWAISLLRKAGSFSSCRRQPHYFLLTFNRTFILAADIVTVLRI